MLRQEQTDLEYLNCVMTSPTEGPRLSGSMSCRSDPQLVTFFSHPVPSQRLARVAGSTAELNWVQKSRDTAVTLLNSGKVQVCGFITEFTRALHLPFPKPYQSSQCPLP
jgi:hypothetical protein